MYESLLQVDVLWDKKESHFLKMLLIRSQKPIKISDYGVFHLCMHDFKSVRSITVTVYWVRTYEISSEHNYASFQIGLHTYQLCSSLVSFKAVQ